MKHPIAFVATTCVAAACLAVGATPVETAAAQGPATGTIVGHVRLTGVSSANPLIRMGADPLCSRFNRGKKPIQQYVVRSAEGGLANTFVRVEGAFPNAPVTSEPVILEQKDCVYLPRVVGVRIGQKLLIRNNDTTLHNLHGISANGNDFNVTQPNSGMVYIPQFKGAEIMLRLKCDVHSWMTAYVGVMTHPYFSVSGADGTFTIANVPAGSHAVRSWHERFGEKTKTVVVKAGQTVMVDFTYGGTEKPAAALQELVLPTGVMTATRVAAGDASR